MASINDYMMQDHAACDARFERAADAARSANWAALQSEAGAFLDHIALHIELEEDLLFPAFEEDAGMSSGGPTETMRSEHQQMQPMFAQMREAAESRDAAAYLGMAQTLHDLLQQHNMKEEQMMYPMLDQSLGAEAAAAMVDKLRRALSETA